MYVRETAAGHGVDPRIGDLHWVQRASWSKAQARARVAELGRLPGNARIAEYRLPSLGGVFEVVSHRLLCLADPLVLDGIENFAAHILQVSR